mmetsp:Transcript_35262/g.59423  ORF Transcript_35262/g.59423 Transcript_35262/m.59423 type:complete len:361 (-) Transcript_35262:1536-2618(-)
MPASPFSIRRSSTKRVITSRWNRDRACSLWSRIQKTSLDMRSMRMSSEDMRMLADINPCALSLPLTGFIGATIKKSSVYRRYLLPANLKRSLDLYLKDSTAFITRRSGCNTPVCTHWCVLAVAKASTMVTSHLKRMPSSAALVHSRGAATPSASSLSTASTDTQLNVTDAAPRSLPCAQMRPPQHLTGVPSVLTICRRTISELRRSFFFHANVSSRLCNTPACSTLYSTSPFSSKPSWSSAVLLTATAFLSLRLRRLRLALRSASAFLSSFFDFISASLRCPKSNSCFSLISALRSFIMSPGFTMSRSVRIIIFVKATSIQSSFFFCRNPEMTKLARMSVNAVAIASRPKDAPSVMASAA